MLTWNGQAPAGPVDQRPVGDRARAGDPAVTFTVQYRTETGTVSAVRVPTLAPLERARQANKWVRLPNGDRIRPTQVISVAREAPEGQVVEAWTVAAHGLSGQEAATAPAKLAPCDWLALWRRAAALTADYAADDPRMVDALATLDRLDEAYRTKDLIQAQACLRALEQLRARLAAPNPTK